MEVMSELHARGLTILLVTHDADVANHAHRIIELKDGKILSDKPNPTAPSVPAVETEAPVETVHKPMLFRGLREGWILVKQSVRSLLSNKVRTALSALGIMIGVAAVIATIAIANGAKAEVEKTLSRLGSNLLSLYPQRRSRGGVSQGQGGASRLTEQDAQAIREEVAHVIHVSSQLDSTCQVKAGNKNWSTRVEGVDPDYEVMRSYQPTFGRFFTEEEGRQRARVALIGVTVLRELFGETNPVGQEVKINRQTFTIIGVLPEKGSSGFRDNDDIILIPLQTGMYRLFGEKYVERIDSQVDEAENMERVQADILALMAKRHRIGNKENPFQIRNLAEIQDTMSATSDTMAILLSSIAAIALVVGGIGIMNIMLVSVTERTREIGLRKALGARRKDIMLQFLIEALIISFFGGCAGAGIGAGASIIMSKMSGWSVLITQESILLAFIFSAVIGVLFGIWPARKAAKLNPIDALRYE